MGIAASPWNQRTQVRGLEFSTTPLPVLRREAFLSGCLFDERTLTCVPAMATKTVNYAALLTRVPNDFGNIRDIQVTAGHIVLYGNTRTPLPIRASGINNLLQ
jgi:hypothetical protein